MKHTYLSRQKRGLWKFNMLANRITIPLAGLCLSAGAGFAPGQSGGAAAPTAMPAKSPGSDGPAFPVSKFDVDFVRPMGRQWQGDLQQIPITLGRMNGAYVAPRAGVPEITLPLHSLSKGEARDFHESALMAITDQIKDYFEHRGLIFVAVGPSSEDLKRYGTELRDERPDGDTDLHLSVMIPHVTSVRTIAMGNRVPLDKRINNPANERIRRNSPVQASPSTQPSDTALLHKDALGDYVFQLNRHPGRHVDVAVSQGPENGTAVLDYLVREDRPWTLYAQVSNTGTSQTKKLRERFGFNDTNVTGHDDIFTLDYVTADFSSASQSVIGSYQLPLLDDEKLWLRGYSSYSAFVASDVGRANQSFHGNETIAGMELTANLFQHRELFVDGFVGMRFESVATTNVTPPSSEGSGDFGIPYAGLRLNRDTQISSLEASVTGEAGWTEASEAQLDGLQRPDVDRQFGIVQGDATYSFFLEPLLHPDRFTQGKSTLANEVLFSVRGQSALGSRLIPEEQQIAGGLYTVRGYPESLVAGDDAVLATAEYRFHVPRAFNVEEHPKQIHVFGSDYPFRFAPDRAYGTPDWDLILKGFVDGAKVWQSNRSGDTEDDSSLLSVGVGVELQVKQFLNVQVDWGIPLVSVGTHTASETIDPPVTSGIGDSRVSFAVTLFY